MTNEAQVNGLTFQEWMDKVDSIITDRIGVSSEDLTDFCSYDAWSNGDTPEEGASECIENDGTFC